MNASRQNRMFGRNPRNFNPRVPHLSSFLAGQILSPPPSAVDYTADMTSFGMMLNDNLGDCTCAAYYHARQVWTFRAQGGVEVTEPDLNVELLYEQACGYDPQQGRPGPGGNEQNVLTYLLNIGAPIGINCQTRQKIFAFVEVDPRNNDDVRRCICDCGVAYIGFPVHTNFSPDEQVWDYDPSASLTDEGHAVVLAGYNATGAIAISWGQLYTMTWAFISNVVDEVYAIADSAWITATGLTPVGMTLAQLEGQMQAIKGQYTFPS